MSHERLGDLITNNRAAVAASVAVLALGAGATLRTNTAKADTVTDTPAECMADGLYSLTGGMMQIDSTGTITQLEVAGAALPADCDGQVWRTVTVEQLAGTDPQNLSPNTNSYDVFDGNGAFDNTINAQMINPYACGTYYQQETTFSVTTVSPNAGLAPESKTYLSTESEQNCQPATTGSGSGAPSGSGSGTTVSPQPSEAQKIKSCEIDAVDSVRYISMQYLKPAHHQYKRVRQIVKADALPKSCDNLVQRKIEVQARLGRKGHVKPDSRYETLDTRDGKIYEYINQTLKHAWRSGEKTQQAVKVIATPMKAYDGYGVKPMTKQYFTKAA
ncbi:MAG TPA: hypothetical protein VFN51_03010 [Candidatus Saccharimonadales bacterium]|nr:hypothetical protein [Candidatus Saccharimonadales bacterium]